MRNNESRQAPVLKCLRNRHQPPVIAGTSFTRFDFRRSPSVVQDPQIFELRHANPGGSSPNVQSRAGSCHTEPDTP
jgi:hypothetical protein